MFLQTLLSLTLFRQCLKLATDVAINENTVCPPTPKEWNFFNQVTHAAKEMFKNAVNTRGYTTGKHHSWYKDIRDQKQKKYFSACLENIPSNRETYKM